jgi:phosphohistidine phosphatase
MPELLLLRHGKSDWDAAFGHDRDRPLSSRGVAAAGTMGRVLTAMRKQPELVLTSPARRARSTAELAAEAGEWTASITDVEELYGAGPGAVFSTIAATEPDVGRLMIVGHEPTWSHAASLLIGGGSVRVVTGAVTAIEVPSWSRVEPGAGLLRWMLTPRLFTDGDFEI